MITPIIANSIIRHGRGLSNTLTKTNAKIVEVQDTDVSSVTPETARTLVSKKCYIIRQRPLISVMLEESVKTVQPYISISPSIQLASLSLITGCLNTLLLNPFDVWTVRRTVKSAEIGTPLKGTELSFLQECKLGLSLSLATRVGKAGLGFFGMDYLKEQFKTWDVHPGIRFGVMGGLTGALEGVIFNPVTVARTLMQADPSLTTWQALKRLNTQTMFDGALFTAGRNTVCSAVAMASFYTLTASTSEKELPFFESVSAGAISFFLGALATVPLEAKRLDKVLKISTEKGFSARVIRLAPGLIKVGILGGTYGPGLSKVFFGDKRPHQDNKQRS